MDTYIDFSKIQFCDIEGNVLERPIDDRKQFHKVLASTLYENARDLGMAILAQEIYKGCPIEVTEPVAQEVKRMLGIAIKQKSGPPQLLFKTFVRKRIDDLMNEVIEFWHTPPTEHVNPQKGTK